MDYILELTLDTGKPLLICSNTIAVTPRKDGGSTICDGLHNNGGWRVQEECEHIRAILVRQRRELGLSD